jgi:chlorobactene glucosyltransferase
VRMLTAAVTRQRLGDALLMPLSVLLMTRIAIQAVWWRWRYGGPHWKGRTIGKRQ